MRSSDSEHNPNGGSKPPAPDQTVPSGTGIIKHYNATRGFGFIARHGDPDLFFHVSDIVDNDIAVEIGQCVRFEVTPSPRKPGLSVAVKVQRYGEQNPEDGKGRGDDG